MASQLTVNCLSPGRLFGVGAIELMIDGQAAAELAFGQATTVSIAPGQHTAQVSLRGVLTRQSNRLAFACVDGQSLAFTVKYSKLWGNVRIAAQ